MLFQKKKKKTEILFYVQLNYMSMLLFIGVAKAQNNFFGIFLLIVVKLGQQFTFDILKKDFTYLADFLSDTMNLIKSYL